MASLGHTQQLEFSQAMADFKLMFPSMDADVIEAVLRANGGAVAATIDHLLTMSADTEAQGAVVAGQDLIVLEQDPTLSDDREALGAAGGSPNATSCGVNVVPTPQQLQDIYENNLRQREAVRTSQLSTGGRSQFLEDERIALMLQNEEFMMELRGDHDFLSALEQEQVAGAGGAQAQPLCDRSGVADASRPQPFVDREDGAAEAFMQQRGITSRTSMLMDEALFREKLKNMGQKSKRKFAQLAGLFSRRKGAKQLLGHAPAPSHDNLLLNADPSNNEDSEDEAASRVPTPQQPHQKAPSRSGSKYTALT